MTANDSHGVVRGGLSRARKIRNSVRDMEKGETRRKEVNDEDSIDTGIR